MITPYMYPMPINNRVAQIVSLFNRKNATSEDRSIEISMLDYFEMGFTKEEKALETKYSFVHKKDNKYWIDAEDVKNYYQREKNTLMLSFFILFLVILALVYFLVSLE